MTLVRWIFVIIGSFGGIALMYGLHLGRPARLYGIDQYSQQFVSALALLLVAFGSLALAATGGFLLLGN